MATWAGYYKADISLLENQQNGFQQKQGCRQKGYSGRRDSKRKKEAKEYEELDKEIKEKFKGKTAVVGDFIIESKELVRKAYEIPDEVKKAYEKQMTYWVTKIKRLGE